MDERRRALHIDIADDTGGKYPLRGDTEKRYENEKKLIMYKLFDNSHEIEEKKRNQKNEFGVGYHKDFFIKIPADMEVAPRYTLLLSLNTVDTVYAFQTALHCLNNSMYVNVYDACIYCYGGFKTLLKGACWRNIGLDWSGVEWTPLRLL